MAVFICPYDSKIFFFVLKNCLNESSKSMWRKAMMTNIPSSKLPECNILQTSSSWKDISLKVTWGVVTTPYIKNSYHTQRKNVAVRMVYKQPSFIFTVE